MRVHVINECGFNPALLGLGLSHGVTSGADYFQFLDNQKEYKRMETVAGRLHKLDGGHNKFLESIQVWIDVIAPRYWWQQMDTYRIGVTKQSESTMHTLIKHEISEEMFEGWLYIQCRIMEGEGGWKR